MPYGPYSNYMYGVLQLRDKYQTFLELRPI